MNKLWGIGVEELIAEYTSQKVGTGNIRERIELHALLVEVTPERVQRDPLYAEDTFKFHFENMLFPETLMPAVNELNQFCLWLETKGIVRPGFVKSQQRLALPEIPLEDAEMKTLLDIAVKRPSLTLAVALLRYTGCSIPTLLELPNGSVQIFGWRYGFQRKRVRIGLIQELFAERSRNASKRLIGMSAETLERALAKLGQQAKLTGPLTARRLQYTCFLERIFLDGRMHFYSVDYEDRRAYFTANYYRHIHRPNG